VRVGRASPDEIDALGAESGEELTAWRLLAIRDPTARTTVHDLGRLGGSDESWLSFPLLAADR